MIIGVDNKYVSAIMVSDINNGVHNNGDNMYELINIVYLFIAYALLSIIME